MSWSTQADTLSGVSDADSTSKRRLLSRPVQGALLLVILAVISRAQFGPEAWHVETRDDVHLANRALWSQGAEGILHDKHEGRKVRNVLLVIPKPKG